MEKRGAGRAADLLTRGPGKAMNYSVLGLEVDPVYRDPTTGDVYPLLLRELHRELSRAFRRAFFEFARKRAGQATKHFHMLGRQAVVKAVWGVDRGLATVADSFDMLLQLTPVNAAEAWRGFQRSRYQRAPVFRYRPLPVDPLILKRKLYGVPLERVEDPALESIFSEKLDELDRQITLMLDLNTERFVHGSIQLFGKPDGALLDLAHEILDRFPPRTRESSRNATRLDAADFARLAREELGFYQQQWPEVRAEVEVRADIASGLMVSRGKLLIGSGSQIPKARVDALLQHEVGTHLVTYYNGRAQPFRQLYSGLAGYEALQEGLAVLSEYLVGGLSRPRLRLLAARVITAQLMIDGATFVDTFRQLNKGYGFEQKTAFTLAMRIYRGGGLTKDAIYLRGLREVLSYLKAGGKLEPLYVGKIALVHVPVIDELRWRGVLRQSPLVPRYLQRPDTAGRLEGLRRGANILDLTQKGQQ
ncbi:MAG: flavohemoglobin expression-modulating QEGLA motif protein [Gemmatimonadales bacterium]|nr:MAG: flavohemoglobin expression-modulating QEGLA motif protein [Gemmatimonadales bacterium]